MSHKSQVWSGIVLLLVVTALIVVYFIWTGSTTEDTHPLPVITDASSQSDSHVLYKTYFNAEHGFRVQYPENWFVEESGSEEVFSVQFRGDDRGVTISSMPLSLEGIVRDSINITEESEIDVNGLPATHLTGTNPKDGGSYSVVLIPHGEIVYSISGSGQAVDDVVNYFELP